MWIFFLFVTFLVVCLDVRLTGGRTIRRPMSELVGWFIVGLLAVKALRWLFS